MKPDLLSLKARVLAAHTRGYKVAWAEQYVEDLGGKAPPVGVAPNSTEHLLYLLTLAEENDAAPVTQESPTLAAPVQAEPVAEPTPEPVAEPVQVATEETPAEAAPEAAPEAPVEGKKSKKSKK